MKWLALLFFVLNLLVWYGAGALQAPAISGSAASGNLPRVASLKSTAAEPVVAAAAGNGAAEPAEADEAPPEPAAPPEAALALSPEAPATEQAKPAPACVRIGWLESAARARSLIEGQSQVQDLEITVEEVTRELPPYHWVIIPPQPPTVALKQFRDIQRQGIDSFLVTEGENRNAISLGLFESREAAISVLEEKKRQNLNAVLVNFPRNQISYALVFEAEPDLAKEVVQAVEKDYGSDFDFVEINPCEGVASPQKNP